jgi:myo-inositol-1(or 4)-monophosphatase
MDNIRTVAQEAPNAYNNVMNINDLRSIGKSLFKEIQAERYAPGRNTAVRVGAAGDKTFPVDSLAEEIILAGLKALKEPLTIISEEMGIMELNNGGPIVLIDPVDGSKNSVAGIPFYCTSIAFSNGGTLGDVSLSYIINLVNGDEFWAEKGSGAWLNGKQIHAQEDDIFSLVSYEAPVPGKDIPAITPLLSQSRKTRCMGATALDLAYLANGAASVFVTPALSRSFDFAGGWLLVMEAGGVITDTSGALIENTILGLGKSSSLLAAGNPQLHKKALELLSGGKELV